MTIVHSAQWSARLLRRITMLMVSPALLLMFDTEVLNQFVELQDRDEAISAGIVIALLSMSGLSFAWSSSLSDLGDRARMGPRIHLAGVGLFTAALLALIALLFIWIKLPAWIAASWLELFLFALHWLFLLLAMIYATQSVWELFKVAMVERG